MKHLKKNAHRADLAPPSFELVRKRHEEEQKKGLEQQARDLAWSQRWGPWIARAALVAALLLTAGLFLDVCLALWTGEANDINKYSKRIFAKDSEPMLYWLSIVFHASMTAFFVWVSARCFRSAKLNARR